MYNAESSEMWFGIKKILIILAYLEVFHNFPVNRPISNQWFTRSSVCCEIGNRRLLPDAVYFSLDYKLLISSKTLELTKVTKERELDHTEVTERTVLCSSVCAHSLQLCLTLGDPMNCSLPVSSDHGILQARILEWVAMPSSKGSSQPRDRTCISYIAGRFLLLSHWGSAIVCSLAHKSWFKNVCIYEEIC